MFRSSRYHTCAFAILLWILPAAYAQELQTASPESVGLSSDGLARIEPVVRAFIDQGDIAGAITLVARQGKIVHFEAFGLMDIASTRPMRRDTIMRIYSMSKPVTSVAIMILCDQGKCNLDDPVARYIPGFKAARVFVKGTADDIELQDAKRPMTILDLLRHTSGLIYGFGDTPVDRKYQEAELLTGDSDLAEVVSRLARLPLMYQPGQRWNYGMSTDVLGRVVEVLSGTTLDQFFAAHIFKPLDMKDTGFYVPASTASRLASNYSAQEGGEGLKMADGPLIRDYLRRPGFLSGGGGLVSTARDYARFCQMLLNKGALHGTRVLRAGTVETMTRNQLTPETFPIRFGDNLDEGVGFGLGFAVRVNEAAGSAGRVGEYGWAGAASTHFWISPEDDLFVIALSQFMPYSPRLSDTIKPLVYDAILTKAPSLP